MVDSIALSSQVRTNLASVQRTQANVDSTNEKLGTGTKVGGGMSSHNQDEVTLIHSQEQYDRASTFDQGKDGLTQGIDGVKTMSTGIESASSMIDTMKAYVGSMQTADSTEDYNAFNDALSETAGQYDDLLKDAKYNGQSFLNNDQASSTIQVSPDSQHSMTLQGVDVSSNNPKIDLNGIVTNASSGASGIETAKDLLDTASSTLKANNIKVNAQSSLLDSRKSFNTKYSEAMKNSADNETDVDALQNATELTASNVQNKLGQNSLALSAKQGAFVLNLVESTN